MSIQDVLEGRSLWTVETGDCLEILPTLPDKSVAHVITDPPYEAEAHTKHRRVLKGTSPGRPARWGAVARESADNPLNFSPMTPGGRAAAGAEIARTCARWALVFAQVEAAMLWRVALAPLRYMRTCVWVKPDGMPQFTGDRPGVGYESIVVGHALGRSRWNGGGKVGVFSHVKNVSGSQESAPHPTTKPTALMLELVELFTDPGDLVLDPFAGSGTTGVACLRLGRRFIGIEKDEKYASIARERLTAEGQGLSLRDARHGQIGMFGTP